MTWPRSWYVAQGRLVQLTAVGRRRTVRCWSYAYGISGFYEMRAKLDSVVYALRITAVVFFFSLSLSRVFCLPVSLRFLYCSGLIIRSASKFFPLVPNPCFIIGYARSSFQLQAFPWCHAVDQRLGRGALPPGTWTLKGAFTGRTLLVSLRGAGRWFGAFIADTEASRTLTSEGNVTGSSSSTHSLSSPSLWRGTAHDPQEHSSLVFF